MKKALTLLTVLAILSTTSLLAKELAKTTIKVKGASCEDCVTKIEKAVSKVDGVKSVNFCFKSGIAQIEFDKSKTDVTKLEAAIAAVRYDAGETKSPNPHKCTEDHAKEQQKTRKGCCDHERKAKSCCEKESK